MPLDAAAAEALAAVELPSPQQGPGTAWRLLWAPRRTCQPALLIGRPACALDGAQTRENQRPGCLHA